jgi:ferritin-like metal-binding protein YciE
LKKYSRLQELSPAQRKRDAMEGILKESDDPHQQNSLYYPRCQYYCIRTKKVKHYEIATYGTLYRFRENAGRKQGGQFTLAMTLMRRKSDA